MQFPRLDLASCESDWRKADIVDAICQETGFLILDGHGVPDYVIDDIRAATRVFFALPQAAKDAVRGPYPGYPYGYLGPDAEALARSRGQDTPPDLKESFNGGPLHVPDDPHPDALAFCYQPTLWPDLPGFRDAWQAYYAEMEVLAARIMRVFAVALGRKPEFFTPHIGKPISALRALHYPALAGRPAPGQQRAGAHTDYGTLTILLPQPGSAGLQVRARSGQWLELPAPEDAFIVNIGDLMARWTADRWVSTLHRVVARPADPARQSLAFFHQPDWDAEIAPLDGSDRYAPVRSGPYLMQRFRAAAGRADKA